MRDQEEEEEKHGRSGVGVIAAVIYVVCCPTPAKPVQDSCSLP